MNQKRPFRLLLDLLQDRFFESDDAAPGAGFQTNITQVLGFLFASGFVVILVMMPAVSYLVNHNQGVRLSWVLLGLQLFSPAYTFAVIGFATFFEWDMLFPNRRDFLILAAFPIRLRHLFAAQLTALIRFLALLIVAVNFFPSLFVVLMAFSGRFGAGALRTIAAQAAATVGVSAFAFFSVCALQGVLINLTSPRTFRRISPYIQMAGMCFMILSLLTFPLYMPLLRHAAETRQLWLWLFPPVWFTSLYSLFFPGAYGLFATLGVYSLKMLAAAIATFAVTWIAGFRRHYRRTLESEDSQPRIGSARPRTNWARTSEERAIFHFTGQTLARSRKHQLFLVTYLSVGISVAVNAALDVRDGQLVLADDGVRTVPFLILFFVISGFRAVFQFPAELSSNWLFRITAAPWAEISRTVCRKRVVLSGLLPAVFLLLPAAIALWGAGRAAFHTIFELAAGALLIELMFWTFDKVPFTCSYFPGRTNLSILFVLYLYGFTLYSGQMADLESSLERRALYAALFFIGAALVLTWFWRRRPAPSAVRFDAAEPTIQTLDLS